MAQIIATIKEEYTDSSPDKTFPKWVAYVGESREHLEGRMRNKGCDPSKYEWSGNDDSTGESSGREIDEDSRDF
jgi:hypothetical protein